MTFIESIPLGMSVSYPSLASCEPGKLIGYLADMPPACRAQALRVSRRLRRPWKKKGILRGHPAPRPGDCVPRHPLLNSYEPGEQAIDAAGSPKNPRYVSGLRYERMIRDLTYKNKWHFPISCID